MRREDLVADCQRCAAVCCVEMPFEASEDFAFGKEAGEPCRYLCGDGRCGVHDELLDRGMLGCAVFDCYGAGPRVTAREVRDELRDAVFRALREVHELLWLLTEAAKLCPEEAEAQRSLRGELAQEIAALDAIAEAPVASLLQLDLVEQRARARQLLRRVGEAIGGRRSVARRPRLATVR